MPPRSARAAAANDRGMQVLELKLSILISGPGQRRNPALDVLTGRLPDERLITLQAGLSAMRSMTDHDALVPFGAETPPPAEPEPIRAPSTMVLPAAAIRMAAVARSARPAASPWLDATEPNQPRLRLVAPPQSRWTRIPVLGRVVAWLTGDSRAYTSRERIPRARLAS